MPASHHGPELRNAALALMIALVPNMGDWCPPPVRTFFVLVAASIFVWTLLPHRMGGARMTFGLILAGMSGFGLLAGIALHLWAPGFLAGKHDDAVIPALPHAAPVAPVAAPPAQGSAPTHPTRNGLPITVSPDVARYQFIPMGSPDAARTTATWAKFTATEVVPSPRILVRVARLDHSWRWLSPARELANLKSPGGDLDLLPGQTLWAPLVARQDVGSGYKNIPAVYAVDKDSIPDVDFQNGVTLRFDITFISGSIKVKKVQYLSVGVDESGQYARPLNARRFGNVKIDDEP